jgi:hypothetical protein
MSKILKGNKKFIILFSISLALMFGVGFALPIEGANTSLYLAPSKGTFFAGSTFSVSIYVDTKGNEINAVEVDLKFPPDILQVTTPTAGESFISEWLTPPSYSNIGGTISFKGGIPGGIKTSAGLVSTITFRAKSPGLARVEFLDSSKVLLNDGKGTPIFTTNFGGVYEILISPPEGPKIFSPTHYDSDIWYSDSNPQFYWEKEEGVTDFSFSFSQNPQENPDNISEGDATLKSYEDVPDGIWYFHLRAKKEGIWGKTSHFPIKIDTTPPQKFELRMDSGSGFVYFDTKDLHSGLDHYEVSILNISETPILNPFFIEATSPYKIPYQKPGKYNVIVRAYDKAGNSQTAEAKFQIISPALSYIEGKGIQVKGILFSWRLIYVILFLFLIAASYLIFYFSRRGYKKGIKEIKEALTEIQKIEEREKETQRLKEKFEEERKKLEEKLK